MPARGRSASGHVQGKRDLAANALGFTGLVTCINFSSKTLCTISYVLPVRVPRSDPILGMPLILLLFLMVNQGELRARKALPAG